LRQVLARYVETEPEQLRFAYGVHGKPELAEAATDVEFNLSHAQDWFALAVSKTRAVGIDIEYSGTPRNCEAIAQSFFSVPEQRQLHQLPAGERAAAFLALWTRKEALLKACGVGLAAPRDLATVFAESSHSLVGDSVTPFAGKLWRIYNLNLQPDLVCALAVQERNYPTQVHVINAMEFCGG
jgi:4'-phosphopantetheinyl transferase